MPTFAENRTYPNLSADQAFEILVGALPEMGYVIWKTRPIGWLIMANRETGQGRLNVSVALRPGTDTVLTFSAASDKHSVDDLRDERLT